MNARKNFIYPAGIVGSFQEFRTINCQSPTAIASYNPGDLISGVEKMIDCSSRMSSGGYITFLQLFTDKLDHTEDIRIHFFNKDPALSADHTPFVPRWDLIEGGNDYWSSATISSFRTEGDGSGVAIGELEMPRIWYQCGSGDVDLWVALEARAAFTPIADQKFLLKVGFDNN